jgi:hypothetical protein
MKMRSLFVLSVALIGAVISGCASPPGYGKECFYRNDLEVRRYCSLVLDIEPISTDVSGVRQAIDAAFAEVVAEVAKKRSSGTDGATLRVRVFEWDQEHVIPAHSETSGGIMPVFGVWLDTRSTTSVAERRWSEKRVGINVQLLDKTGLELSKISIGFTKTINAPNHFTEVAREALFLALKL